MAETLSGLCQFFWTHFLAASFLYLKPGLPFLLDDVHGADFFRIKNAAVERAYIYS